MNAPARASYQPVLTDAGTVSGSRCTRCGRACAPATARCPQCGGPTAAAEFPNTGAVWASTVVHITVGERRPPYALSYVDLDGGPRVLALQAEPVLLACGARVRLEPSSQAWCAVVALPDAP